ncbi:MAG: ATP-binding protein [Acidobacteriota bacterium]|nr:ATP-binding protein [Acidobacteriota bacterium]
MHSLRLKLIVGSLAVLTAVILSFDAFLLIAKRGALLDVLDSRLFAESQSLALRLEIAGGKPSFDPADEAGAESAASPQVRIAAANGRTIYQSPQVSDLAWPAVPERAEAPVWKTVNAGRSGAWRAVTWVDRLEIDAGAGAGEQAAARPETTIAVVVQCAESLAETKEEMRELASLLALLSLAAFLIAGGGSFLLAGRALRPIRRINRALAGVSETRLDGRIAAREFDRELQPLIEQLNAALDRLQKGFQRERQFTSDASHELRTPVASILNSIEVLLRRPRTEPELVEAHRDNWQTARSMQTIIEGLLLLARMDAGKAPMAEEEIPLAPFIEDVLAAAAPEAEAGSVRLAQAVDPGLRILADPAQLRLALSNLVDNAVRYNRPRGSVTVTARTTEGGTTIEVRDTGIGILPAELPRIFERFYRIDPSRTEATGGSGLGLSIVQKVVETRGGRVTAASDSSGSVFTIIWPRR